MYINNERGQILVFVLISASIIFISFTGAVKMYMNIIEESRFLLEQLEVETIVQMSKVDLLNYQEDEEEELSGFYDFVYPNGNIYVRIDYVENNRYLLTNEIVLENKSTYESVYEMGIQE